MISFLRSIIEKTCSAKKIHASIIHLCNALVCFSRESVPDWCSRELTGGKAKDGVGINNKV